MPKLHVDQVPTIVGSRYPQSHAGPCRERVNRRLGDAVGLTQLGVTLTRLPPGACSSQRHWHAVEDEMVYVLEGQATLVTDDGEESLGPGDFAGFKGGVREGHCVQNRSQSDVVLLAMSSRSDEDHGEYSDVDMMFTAGRYSGRSRYVKKDGSPID